MTAPASPFLVGAADHYWSTLLRQDGDAAYEVVGQEHAATAISEEVVQRIRADLPAPDPTTRPLIVSCAEREFHSLAALVVTTSLRSWG